MHNPTFKFAVVEYLAYNPPRDNCRVSIELAKHTVLLERNDWGTLFRDLRAMYPNTTFIIPETIDVITFDKNFNLK